ncbi:MAG: 2,3-bisphosphoglycerate-independent phosphoglycerate mutase [candidate division WOR-3 bacterium]|nr:2,3-bisphosphoglycerate-independent phosphoglycerate mutase [candidate division WOR-3 bacterium]
MEILSSILEPNDQKILLVVIDGLGGSPQNGKTELETAKTQNLNNLAKKSSLGLSMPIGPGITPGSAPAHLALFGYDPIETQIGRGLLEVLGVGLDVTPKDLCVRANFATIDKNGYITDRRAGRISTEENKRICANLIKAIKQIEDVEVIIRSGKEHRFAIMFRSEGLGAELTDSDPLHEGKKPIEISALSPRSSKSAKIINIFLNWAKNVVYEEPKANYILLRGFAKYPEIESMATRYKIKPACVATYPMYKGIAKLVGMEVLPTGDTWDDEIETVHEHKSDFDFFYLHFKEVDKMGEDGNFEGKVKLLEELDKKIPKILNLNFDVLCITGDHSTPAVLKSHSWHPNPLLIYSAFCRASGIKEFSETACAKGGLGVFPATAVMTLLLAHALKLKKFGP